jgi:hypothetical protein
MQDLGTKRDNMYDHPTSEKDMPKVTYPKLDLPLSFIANKDVKRDDEVEIRLKGKLVGFEDTEYRKIVTFELKEGEIVGKDKEESEEQTLLGGERKELPGAIVEY